MTKERALQHIYETCGNGWLTLVEILYDNCPDDLTIETVYQKWAGLRIDTSKEDTIFDELIDAVYLVSKSTCEICGKSAKNATIKDWERTLCKEHFDSIKTTNKKWTY